MVAKRKGTLANADVPFLCYTEEATIVPDPVPQRLAVFKGEKAVTRMMSVPFL